jgi:hypothetical protein
VQGVKAEGLTAINSGFLLPSKGRKGRHHPLDIAAVSRRSRARFYFKTRL